MEKPAGTPTLDWWSELRKVVACLAPDLAALKLDPVSLGELQKYLLSVAGKTSDRSIKDKCPLIGTALCLLRAADQLSRVDALLRYLVDEVLCGGEAAIAEKTAATQVQRFLCALYERLPDSTQQDLCRSPELTITVHNCLLEEGQRTGLPEPCVCINTPSVVSVLNRTMRGGFQQRHISLELGRLAKKQPDDVIVNKLACFLDCARGQPYHQDEETHERRPVLEGETYPTKKMGCIFIRRAYLDKLGKLRNAGDEGTEAERPLAQTGFEGFYESLKDGTWGGYGSSGKPWLYEIEQAAGCRLNPEHFPGDLITDLAAHRGEQRAEAIDRFDNAVLFTPRLERERPDDDEQSEHGTQRVRVNPPTGGLWIETQGGGQGSARDTQNPRIFDFEEIHPNIQSKRGLDWARGIVLSYHLGNKTKANGKKYFIEPILLHQEGVETWKMEEDEFTVIKEAPSLSLTRRSAAQWPAAQPASRGAVRHDASCVILRHLRHRALRGRGVGRGGRVVVGGRGATLRALVSFSRVSEQLRAQGCQESRQAPCSRPSLPTDVASPVCRPCPEPVKSREHVRIQAQRAAPPNTPASAATRSESAPLLPDRDALCDLHGACRTDAAASQAQQGQLAAQPSTTRTMPRAASELG